MNNNSWSNHPVFRAMDPRKSQVVERLLNNVQGQSMDRAVSGIMEATNTLRAQNLSFTSEESQAIIEAIGSGLPANQQSQFQMILQMLGNIKR